MGAQPGQCTNGLCMYMNQILYVDSRFLISGGWSESFRVSLKSRSHFHSNSSPTLHVFFCFSFVSIFCYYAAGCNLECFQESAASLHLPRYTPQGCLTSCGSTRTVAGLWALVWHDRSCAWSSVWWNFESDMQCPSKFRGKQRVCLETMFLQVWQQLLAAS